MADPVFGDELRVDPRVALPAPSRVVGPKVGPLPKVQFVAELVGPRSVPAAAASHILDPAWHNALGNPRAWCMSPMDSSWKPLTTATDGSYDSLALAWDMVLPNGRLTGTSARTLLARAEEFASHVQRRAMPMPVPEDVDRIAQALQRLRDSLDVGFALVAAPRQGLVSERDLWIVCARLGLTFSSEGSFDWLSPENDLPLLSVTPIGRTESFSLAAVQRGESHEGVTVGFRYALCPSPSEALSASFRVAKAIAEAIGGVVFDEDGRPIARNTQPALEAELVQADRLYSQAGLQPGSSEARVLFR